MINTDASTLPADTRVLVRWYAQDVRALALASGKIVEPKDGTLWTVELDVPLGERTHVSHLTDMGEVIGRIAGDVLHDISTWAESAPVAGRTQMSEPPLTQRPRLTGAERDYRLGLVYGVGDSALSDALSPPRQLDAVLEDPAVFTDLEGDEIRVDIVAYDQTEDAEAENAYPSGTVVEIECIVKPHPDDEDDFTSTASVYLNRETLRDLILHLVEVDELAGYAELARANADELAESTAGDPPNPNGCSGGCAGCSR